MPGEFSVGDRIHSDGHFGTVRYIGPVAGTKGELVYSYSRLESSLSLTSNF